MFGGLDFPDEFFNRRYAVGLLRTYLEQDKDGYCFSGTAFDTYPAPAGTENQITDSDLVAIAMLGIRVTGHEALWITRYHAADIQQLLTRIPAQARIDGQTSGDLLQPDDAAWKLWALLRDVHDRTKSVRLGPVAAGKLLARKRPELIPIADSRTARVLNRPQPGADKRWWEDVRSASLDPKPAADGLPLWSFLASLRDEAGASHLTILRVLDILVWMHGASTDPRGEPPKP
ncbi:hypothetical protein KGA66_21535 [Actinocrinis puniceicyclus]|uniref:Uncharacterized protein n=1 Tax=Actinocrinis puniceicyclus TaxID=977794 RepID=A0A8J8BDU8_9ACTN|nr:DUF6308 family protein [Actinocrinis puniceicyclus]MBS2965648.1 hypothetical protein [Actinocrinis puniceicyclus]